MLDFTDIMIFDRLTVCKFSTHTMQLAHSVYYSVCICSIIFLHFVILVAEMDEPVEKWSVVGAKK